MKCTVAAIVVGTLVLLHAVESSADWSPGDDSKMHFPQLPDTGGWAVNCTLSGVGVSLSVVDDWQCSRSGPVDDIHFWF